MWALADCNSFFASVEKVFHPGLKGRPVCVLSSNDGVIVALTPEAKALGLRRGDPLFKVQGLVNRCGVQVFSGNIMLYAAMSRRVQGIMRKWIAACQSYSIDEMFLDLSGYESHFDMEGYLRDMVRTIRLWTDIPVSIGIAPTRTLAKIGSRFAKQYPGYRSVCTIDNEEKRRKALALSCLADVWGIGRRSCDKLMRLGVRTPLEFADKPAEWVQKHFAKPGILTWKELNGYSCISTEEMLQSQSITTSRSFGNMISSPELLKASVATFAASCANKLRAQGSVAGCITVFVRSNRFRDDLDQYFNASSFKFPVSTADTIEITKAAMHLVDELWREGIQYKKSGVILSGISSGSGVQQMLFDTIDKRAERLELSRTMDNLNHRYGLKTVSIASEGGLSQPWRVKSEHRSGNYLTDLNEILTVNI